MKKRIFSLLTSFLMIISLVSVLPVMTATAETSGDYSYTVLSDGTIEITKYNDAETDVIIPSTIDDRTVTSIGAYAFAWCDNLTSIEIPNSVKYIGDYAFYGCPSLTNITIGNGVTSIGDYAFASCDSLTSITIPDSVTSIGGDAFFCCKSLTNITIPNSVTSIVAGAFSGCSSLKSITIPNSVTSIGDYAFRNCESLTSITVDSNNKNYSSVNGVLFDKNKTELIQYPNGNTRTSYTIPNTVTSIGDYAFIYCESITSITIPNSVKYIGDYAFYGCPSLTNITIPNSVKYIGDYAFYGCPSLTNITIGNGVTSIGEGTFEYCTSLTSITIPNSVKYIGDFAFYGCTSLTSITIPNSVTSIGAEAFEYCESLKSITIPNSVSYIPECAFYECTSLNSITIPKSVTSIGRSAFYDCYNLKDVYYSGTQEEWYSINLESNNKPLINATFHFHEHNYTSQITKQATCTSTGVMTYTCSCGDTYTETIPTTGHIYVDTVVAPTCTEQGYTIHKCTGCGDKYADMFTNPIGHNYFASQVIPTYATEGYTLHKCSACGDEYKDNFKAKLVVPTVTGFKVTATTANAIKLTCNKVAGATGYVYYRASAGKWVKIGVSKTNTFTDTKLKAGTSYKYAVKAYKSVNGKNYYSASYPTLWTSTNPATVSFTVAGGVKKAVLKWSKVTGATGYIAYMKTSANGKWVGLTTTKSLTYTKTGLVKGKTYWFTVKAYRTANGKTYNGAFVTKSVKVK